jgi:hypothetical protein
LVLRHGEDAATAPDRRAHRERDADVAEVASISVSPG